MNESSRVHPGCVNAANAYHECGARCLEKIGKGEKRKDKKKSDNHSGQFIKKKDNERKGQQSCARASNPYHQCDERCSKKTSMTMADALGMKNESVISSTCPKASNAYHECDEFCSKGYGIKQDDLSKKKDARKTVYPNCKRASNPYHECDGNCLNGNTEVNSQSFGKNSGSEIIEASQSFDKKKKESDSELLPPTALDKSPVNHKSPRSHFSLREVELENSGSFSSEQYSDGTYSRDHSFDKEPLQPSTSVPVSGEITPDSETEKAQTSSEGGKDGTNKPTFSLSGVAEALDEINEEEIPSVISAPSVSVGKYHVRADFSSTLQAILERYGDIAANCQLESASLRAYYLEGLCSVVQELHSTAFQQMTKAKVREMFAVLKDAESAKIDVAWLRGMLDHISEAIELITQRHAIEATSRQNSLESTWKKMESSWST